MTFEQNVQLAGLMVSVGAFALTGLNIWLIHRTKVAVVETKAIANSAKTTAESAVTKIEEVSQHTNGITEKMNQLAEQVGIGKGRKEKSDEMSADRQQAALELAATRQAVRDDAVLDAEAEAKMRTAAAVSPADGEPSPTNALVARSYGEPEVPTRDKRVAEATERGAQAAVVAADAAVRSADAAEAANKKPPRR